MSTVAPLHPPAAVRTRPGPPVVAVLGPPGAGAADRAQRFAATVGWPAAAFGDALRREIADGTGLGRHAGAAVRTGDLIPDHLAVGLVRQVLDGHADAPGVVLAGYPRTIEQARALAVIAPGSVRWCVALVAPRILLRTRILTRDRPEETEYAVHRRFLAFDRDTRAVISAYARHGIVRFVDLRRDPVEMTARLVAVARDSGVVEP